MRNILILLLLVFCSSMTAQTELTLRERFTNDTLYLLYNGRELQEKQIIPLRGDDFGTKQYWFYFYFRENIMSEKDFIALIKSNYMDFDLTVPDMKLIDVDWMEKNKDKILDISHFKKYNVVDIYDLLVYRVVYLIEEENFFGNEVYAREVHVFSNYRIHNRIEVKIKYPDESMPIRND